MKIAVYGASGHTARFVLAELLRRGHAPIAIGRDESKVASAVAVHGAKVEIRIASLDAAESLDRALSGVDVVINCAGPFLDTAQPLIEAALRNRVHYFDVTAEQASALSTFELFDGPARERGVLVVPAAGFYGGFGDLLATYAMNGWTHADHIDIAIALDSWQPTLGTRRTGQRNTAPRLNVSNGNLKAVQAPERASWRFAEPFGSQGVIEVPFTEMVLMARHLRVREIRNYLNEAPLHELRDPATPGPLAADDHGRSSQHFLVDVKVRNSDDEHRVTVKGRDIYAITASIVVEAVERVCQGPDHDGGAFALGQIIDASEFLQALARMREIILAPVRAGKIHPDAVTCSREM